MAVQTIGQDGVVNGSEMLSELAAVLDDHRWGSLPALLHPEFTCRYVHTGEHFDKNTWVRLNVEYPEFRRYVLEDWVGDGDRAAGRAHVTSGPDENLHHFHVATFISMRGGLAHEMVEVWTGVAERAGPRPT